MLHNVLEAFLTSLDQVTLDKLLGPAQRDLLQIVTHQHRPADVKAWFLSQDAKIKPCFAGYAQGHCFTDASSRRRSGRRVYSKRSGLC